MPSAITTSFFGAELQLFPIEGQDNLYRVMWFDEDSCEIKHLGKMKFVKTSTTTTQDTVRPTTSSSTGGGSATAADGSTTDEDSLPPPPSGRTKHRRTKVRSGPYTRSTN